MFGWLQDWCYKRYEAKMSASDNFEHFEQFASGPWTPEMARKMPWSVLIKGPQFNGIDAQTRLVIDYELQRRAQPISPVIANVISVVALIVSIIALVCGK